MFKILSMALISLVGMQYANTSGNNIHYAPSNTPQVVGGISYDDINSGFLIPVSHYVDDFYYTGPQTTMDNFYEYNYWFQFEADYVYFKTYLSGVETMYDTRDLSFTSPIGYYEMQVYNRNDSFVWNLYFKDSNGTQLAYYSLARYSWSSQLDQSGLEQFYDNLEHYVFYVSNYQRIKNSDTFIGWYGYNGQSVSVSLNSDNYKQLPLLLDDRYHSLETNYYFPYQPVVYGYWYKDQNSTYYIPILGNVGTFSRPTIFKGYFKCNGEYFRSYKLDGINSEQPSNISGTNGYYFGPYNNVSSLSSAIKPASNTQFWFASDGLFEYFNNGVKPVWYTRTTPVVSSNVEVNVISNSYQWYSYFYQNIYLVYEEVDTSGNLTSISNMSYYDMLSFNTGFISTETDINPLTNALTLVGVAFQQLWSIGNIVLFGTITINSLILLPILISLVLFVIHLIKRG